METMTLKLLARTLDELSLPPSHQALGVQGLGRGRGDDRVHVSSAHELWAEGREVATSVTDNSHYAGLILAAPEVLALRERQVWRGRNEGGGAFSAAVLGTRG